MHPLTGVFTGITCSVELFSKQVLYYSYVVIMKEYIISIHT